MPYVVVENFKGGLDTRRHSLASAPGTLAKLVNGHITRGGELEKRKAMSTYASLTGSYGFEATEEGIVVYKSTNNANSGCIAVYQECTSGGIPVNCAEPGSSWAVNGFGYYNDLGVLVPVPPGYGFVGPYDHLATATVCPIPPSGVIYQYLDHPEGSDLEEVMYSTVYGGKTFAIAKFANGDQIPFFDGQPIKDFTNGYSTSSMGTLANFAEHLRGIIQDQITESTVLFNKNEEWVDPMKDYIVTRLGADLYITGKGTNDFACKVFAEAPITATVTTIAKPLEATSAVNSQCNFIVAGGADGKASAGITLRSIDAAGLPGITGIYVKATSTATADGEEITGLATPLVYTSVPPPSSSVAHDPGQLLAWGIKEVINANSGSSKLKCSYYYNGGNWSGLDPADITISTTSKDGSIYNNQFIHVEFNADPSSISGVIELIDPATVVVSPYNASRFIAVMSVRSPSTGLITGKFNGGSDNCVYSIKVNGTTELLGSRIGWTDSNENTKAMIVNEINANTTAGLNHGYSATGIFGQSTVTVYPPTSIGHLANGYKLEISVNGTMAISGLSMFSGGIAAQPITRKQVKVSIGGTFAAGKTAWILITDPERPSIPYKFGASRVSGLGASVNVAENGGFRFAFTYKYKAYLAVGSTIYFSALNDATKWDVYDTGSGFIDLSSSYGCRDNVTGMGVYQGYVAFFTERNCQLWNLDPDPSLNQQIQIIDNTGCVANGTIISVGAIDLFYLSYNGVRSLRARQSTDSAYTEDVGSPVDEILIKHMRGMTDAEKAASKAIIEPTDGRYWIVIGSRLFVLSTFSSSAINAWSEYDLGFDVEDIVVFRNRVYVKSGQTVYIYGGADNSVYDGSEVVVEMPYLSANKPGTYKEIKGVDATCEGQWTIEAGTDYTNPGSRDVLAAITEPTFSHGRIPVTGMGTHIGPTLTSCFVGYAKISNFIIHYDEQHSKHEAG